MNWKHLKSADSSTETDSQSMSVTQAGKVVKFLVAMVVVAAVALVILVAAESQRVRDRVALAILIFDQSLACSQIPNQDQTLITALLILACSQSQIRAKI